MKPRFNFAKLKDDYLEECGQPGGHPDGFRDYARTYAIANRPEIPDAVDLFVLAAGAAWRLKIKPDLTTGDLMLDGRACPGEISYQEKTAPGGYTTVKFSYCTVDQFRRHCLETTRNANAVQASALKEWEMYEIALERANGAAGLRMVDLLDTAIHRAA